MSAGKGDRPRPVNKKKFDENYYTIFRKNKGSREQRLIELKIQFQSLEYRTSVEGMRLLDEIEKIEDEIKNEESV